MAKEEYEVTISTVNVWLTPDMLKEWDETLDVYIKENIVEEENEWDDFD